MGFGPLNVWLQCVCRRWRKISLTGMAHACGTYGCKEDAVSPHTAHLSGCSCRRTNCSTPNYLSSPGLPLNRLLCLAIGEQESPIPGSSPTVIVPEKIRAPQFELCRVEPLFLGKFIPLLRSIYTSLIQFVLAG